MIFYVGLHHASVARNFARCCISVNTLRRRKIGVGDAKVLLDSGAFTELHLHGAYRQDVSAYAAEIRRLRESMDIEVAVAQDYMCEPFMLKRTGLTLAEHQRLTIERYDALMEYSTGVPIMPVLQGFDPADYSRHVRSYGSRLREGQWVGVGSVCKRNGSPVDVQNVLAAIRGIRPDLRLHGFGVKLTSIADSAVRSMLYSADSMAWCYAARKQGRDRNDWREADNYRRKVEALAARPAGEWQMVLPLEAAS